MAQPNSPLKEGFVLGIIGYVSVALLYTLFDFFAVRGSLYTVDLLGKFVFRGLRNPAVLALPMELDMTSIFWYNVLHIIVALIVGLIVVVLVRHAETKPQAKFTFFVLIAGFIITVLLIGLITTEIRQLLPWWSIVAANSIAVILGGKYIAVRYPGIWGKLNPFSN